MTPNPLYEPLPSVPPASPAAKRALHPMVRSVISLVIAFAVLNIAREITYLIGSIQEFGAPRITDARGLIRSFVAVVVALVTAGGLRRAEDWSWWTAIVGFSLYASSILKELIYLLQIRAAGAPRTELQIVLLGCMIWISVATVILLFTKSVRETFSAANQEEVKTL